MTVINPPAFSSPELQAAFDKARNVLEGADEARNRVSEDIKKLESYLVGLQLAPPFRYSLGKHLEADDDQSIAASLEYGGCADGKICEEAIAFDVDAKGNVRLLFEV